MDGWCTGQEEKDVEEGEKKNKKRDEKRKVKVFQINLEGEAVVMCDLDTCTWPFKTERRESYMVTLSREEILDMGKKKKQKA